MSDLKVSILTDPYSGHEVLAIELEQGGVVGAAYDPRSTSSPVPWCSTCHHCASGLLGRPLSIHVKRDVQTLASRRGAGFIPQHQVPIYEYTVPTNSSPHRLRVWNLETSLVAEARRDGTDQVLRVTRTSDSEVTREGDLRVFSSKILHRCLKFLSSSRPANLSEVEAVLAPLLLAQDHRTKRSPLQKSRPCNRIPWREMLEKIRLEWRPT